LAAHSNRFNEHKPSLAISGTQAGIKPDPNATSTLAALKKV